MKRSILGIFILIGVTCAGQSLSDYYEKLNITEPILQLYKYDSVDTSILLHSGVTVDTLCYCRVIDDRILNCLMNLNDSTDDITITTDHIYLNFNVRQTLMGHLRSNDFFTGSYILSESHPYPSTNKVVRTENYDLLGPGDLFNIDNFLPQYGEGMFKCWTDTTDIQSWLEKGYYDYTVFSIQINKRVTEKDQIHYLLIDPLDSISIEKKGDYHYSNLKQIIVPIDGNGIQGSVVSLINLLGKSNPHAVVYLSFRIGDITDSLGNRLRGPNIDAFQPLKKIKTNVHVDVEPFYPSHLDSFVALIPVKRIKSLRLIFPEAAKEAVDLGHFQSIRKFKNLEEIYFEGKTRNLPPGIEKLKKLKLLSGAFEYIPYNLGQIRSLEALELNCVYMDSLNYFDNHLTALKLLQLDYLNDINKVPSSFANSEQLQVLKLTDWDSLSTFSAFHDLPIELLILVAGRRPWSFMLDETQAMQDLRVIAYGSGEHFDPKEMPFEYIKTLYLDRPHPDDYYLDSPLLNELRRRNKLVLVNSPNDLRIQSVSDSVQELIKYLRWFPLYELEK